MKKNKLIALFAGLSLAFVGSAALAAPSADTLLVAGYDSNQMAVLYGVSSIDQEADDVIFDCTVVEGEYVYALDNGEEVEDGTTEVDVTGLWEKDKTAEEDKGAPVEFFFEDDEKPSSKTAITYGDLYASEDGVGKDCLLTSVKIEPNGNDEINHGKVVSTFAKLLKGGNGCLIRHFAQSGFGKGDYDEFDEETFEVTLQSFATACEKKDKGEKKDDDASSDDDDDSESRGKSNAPVQEKKDKSDKGGKDKAPGQQKKVHDDDSSSD